jgi:Reverse transcriptase (RNA-dependent DNA polymerase)
VDEKDELSQPIPKDDWPRVQFDGCVPTIADRVAQTVVKMVLEPLVEPCFHPDSYGYRPKRSALDAVAVARKRCWGVEWVIDLDIKAFFDSIPHDLVERAVAHHTELAWVRLYVSRWLRAPVERPDGILMERARMIFCSVVMVSSNAPRRGASSPQPLRAPPHDSPWGPGHLCQVKF